MAETTGLRTKFYREKDNDPGTFEEIAQIATIQPPQPEREVAEVDELNPPGDVRKKLAGLIDAGEVVVTLNFDHTNAGHLALEQDFRDGDAHKYQIKLPTGWGWEFTGIVTGYQPQEISSGDVVQAQATITLTGLYTFDDLEGGE